LLGQLVQTVPGLHQRFQHAEVVEARQGFAHRHRRWAPGLLNQLVVAQKLTALVAPGHGVEHTAPALHRWSGQQRRAGLLHLLGRKPQRIGQKRCVAQRLQVVQA
jgi:hypothetical protein